MTLPYLAAAAAAVLQPVPTYDTDLLIACSAPLGQQPQRPGLSITDGPDAEDELRSLRVTVDETRAFMRIFYDPASERIARARAACLGEQIVALAHALGDKRRGAEWNSVVFTQDPDYIPPRGTEVVPRWKVAVASDGTLTLPGHSTVVSVIPHEQVHAWQSRNGADLPRWVAEGHATWMQRRIAPAFDPIVAAKADRSMDEKLAALDGPLNLARWGSVQPKMEAVKRQVSPEDWARMEADPTYSPSGTFSFGPNDFEQDMTLEGPSYSAASSVFAYLAERHGEDAVREWVTSLTASSQSIAAEYVDESLARIFNEDPKQILQF